MTMKSIETSIMEAMDGTNEDIVPYLSYILQDIQAIGTFPEIFIELVGKHVHDNRNLMKVLDLGCGKGVISIKLAKKYGCTCYGIDGIPEFIEEAKKKASKYGVEHLCDFEVGDIRTKIEDLKDFDIAILGAIGPVFGSYYNTLTAMKRVLNRDGLVMIDDGYIEDTSDYTHPSAVKKSEIIEDTKKAQMSLIDEVIISSNEMKKENERIFNSLKKRCFELMEKYPNQKELFRDYVRNQEIENDVLENEVVCSVMVIKNESAKHPKA